MKKPLFVLFLTIILSSITVSQNLNDIKISWGKETKETKKTRLKSIIGYDETGYYILKQKFGQVPSAPSKYTLEHYDVNMNRTRVTEINKYYTTKNDKVEFVILIKNELYLFWSSPNKSKKQCLYRSRINKNNLTVNKDKKLLVEPKIAIQDQSYDYAFSNDTSLLLVYYNQTIGKRQRKKIGLNVYDTDFNPVWNKCVTLPYKEDLFESEQYIIDRDGNVYITGLIYASLPKKSGKITTEFKYHILKFLSKGDELIEYPVQIKDYKVTDVIMRVTDEQNIDCTGYCSEKDKYFKTGCYYFVIDKNTKKNLNEKLNWIGEDITFKDQYNANDNAKDEFSCNITGFRFLEDNSSILIGEHNSRLASEHAYTNASGSNYTSYTQMYLYSDVYIVKRDPEGKLVWATIVKKRQDTPSDNGFHSSYVCAEVNDKLYFVFSDHYANLKYTGKDVPERFFNNPKKSVVMLVEVDSEANQSRKILSYVKNTGVFVRAKVSEQLSANELILVGRKGAKMRMGKIRFGE